MLISISIRYRIEIIEIIQNSKIKMQKIAQIIAKRFYLKVKFIKRII